MMELKIVRKYLKPEYTIGRLWIAEIGFCDTLEDVVRSPGIKVYGKTAIPAGRYKVVMTFSNRFQRILPELLDVPGFTSIRIHPGNTTANTDGCILVGRNTIKGGLTESRVYSDAINRILEFETDIWIEVV